MTPTGRPRVRVVQLQRRTFSGHYSMERVFAQVRAALPGWVDVELVVTSHYNQGVLPRIRTVLEARRHQGDVTHITGDIHYAALLLRRRTTLLTVHDIEFLERAGRAKRLAYTWLWVRLPVWRAALITVPSEATRQDVLRLVPSGADRVRVVPLPVADEFIPLPGAGEFTPLPAAGGSPLPAAGGSPFPAAAESTPLAVGARRQPVVLLVGTRPNKNIVRAAAALGGLDCRAVVVGALNADQRAAFTESGVAVEVRQGLNDEEIRQAYGDCDVLLFVSTKEGFGIPVLEAQATGRPVVTSNRPPLPDVAGGAACLVDPLDVASIRAGVQRVLSDADYRAELVRRGLDNVRRYRVASIAAQYAAVYEELARRR